MRLTVAALRRRAKISVAVHRLVIVVMSPVILPLAVAHELLAVAARALAIATWAIAWHTTARSGKWRHKCQIRARAAMR